MRAALQLKVGQNLAITPQLQHAIRLLQLSTLELQAEIQEALESNIMLEAEDDQVDDKSKYEEIGPSIEAVSETPDPNTNITEELPIDSKWEDVFDESSPPYTLQHLRGTSLDVVEQQGNTEKNLREHLLGQLALTPIPDPLRPLAEAIIDALDEYGYLKTPIEEICSIFEDNCQKDMMSEALKWIQNLDPSGVGARDLQECILLQLMQYGPDTPWLDEAKRLTKHHFQLLAKRDFKQITKHMNLDLDQVQQIITLLKSVHPRPGAPYHQLQTEYIIPDIYVKKTNGRWQTELNTSTVPKLHINDYYASMIQHAKNSADHFSLKTHLQEARWFIKNIKNRNKTLLLVANMLISKQANFLEYGELHMKPLVMNEVANSLNLHNSTISRVTNKKYMHTPRGIFEFKYFFSSHITSATGEQLSSTAIQSLIKKMVKNESKNKPLSDSEISKMLTDKGITIARRTVAKYRELMSILPSRERKGYIGQ